MCLTYLFLRTTTLNVLAHSNHKLNALCKCKMTLQCGVQIELAFLTSCFAAAPSLDAHDVRCIESRARLDILISFRHQSEVHLGD